MQGDLIWIMKAENRTTVDWPNTVKAFTAPRFPQLPEFNSALIVSPRKWKPFKNLITAAHRMLSRKTNTVHVDTTTRDGPSAALKGIFQILVVGR